MLQRWAHATIRRHCFQATQHCISVALKFLNGVDFEERNFFHIFACHRNLDMLSHFCMAATVNNSRQPSYELLEKCWLPLKGTQQLLHFKIRFSTELTIPKNAYLWSRSVSRSLVSRPYVYRKIYLIKHNFCLARNRRHSGLTEPN